MPHPQGLDKNMLVVWFGLGPVHLHRAFIVKKKKKEKENDSSNKLRNYVQILQYQSNAFINKCKNNTPLVKNTVPFSVKHVTHAFLQHEKNFLSTINEIKEPYPSPLKELVNRKYRYK